MPTWPQMLAWGVPGLMALGALAWLIWALFADRSRGRARCPKCAYDMAGAGGLTCPECGRTVRTQRGLYRTRRRWRQAACAALLLVMAYPVRYVIRAQQVGWVRAVPTVVLVEVAPLDEAAWAPLFAGPSHPLTVELCRRGNSRELTMRQWRRLVARVRHERPDLLALYDGVWTRKTWSRDTTVDVWIYPQFPFAVAMGLNFQDEGVAYRARMTGSPASEITLGYGLRSGGFGTWGPPGAADRCSIDIDLCLVGPDGDSDSDWASTMRPLISWPQAVSFDVVDHATDILTPCSESLRWPDGSMRPRLHVEGAHQLVLSDVDTPASPCAAGVQIEVRRSGILVASGSYVLRWRQGFRLETGLPLTWVGGAISFDPAEARWTLTFIGDVRVALREFSVTEYWEGRATFDIGPDGAGTLAAPEP